METALRELMQAIADDPPHHVTAEAVRRRMLRRRRVFAVAGAAAAVAVLAAAVPAFTGAYSQSTNGSPAGSYVTRLPNGLGSVYHDAAGWMIDIPPGWHVVSFHSSKDGATAAGVQISSVPLPAPTIMPGFPIQASGERMPADAVSVIIATDNDPKLCRPGRHRSANGCQNSYASLPISFRQLIFGSAPAGSPVLGYLWLKANGKALSLTAKFGADAFSPRFINPVSKAIASLAVTRPRDSQT